MTLYVQPCDAGTIKCTKAIYRNLICICALDCDEVDEEDIFKLNILEAMVMMKEAWGEMTSETIENCWRHTKILPELTIQLNQPES